jgi:hypothetical protein
MNAFVTVNVVLGFKQIAEVLQAIGKSSLCAVQVISAQFD